MKVGSPANGGITEDVRCLVDSGASYSLIPRTVLERPGIAPLLGATTLEGFDLALDAFRRELRPLSLPLKRAIRSRSTPRSPQTRSTGSRQHSAPGW